MKEEYLWIGLELPKQFENKVRKYARLINTHNLSEVAFSLPQHISLRISVKTDKVDEIMTDLSHYFSLQNSFTLKHDRVDSHPGLLWIVFEESDILNKLHYDIVELMDKKYGIKPHTYDMQYRFHSTIFYDESADLLTLHQYENKFNKYMKKNNVSVKNVLFGTSSSGKPGEFKVVRNVYLADTILQKT